MDRNRLLQLAQSIFPTSVRDYVKARGWIPVPTAPQRIWIFNHPTVPFVQVMIPKDRDEGTVEALLDAAERLAHTENRPLENVLDDLAQVDSDVIRFRIVSDESRTGSIPLEDAGSLLQGALHALSAAACSVVHPVRHHARTDRNESRQLLQRTRMGQTELGSFVLKVICPLYAVDDPAADEPEGPFAREAVKTLMQGTANLVRLIEDDDLLTALTRDDAAVGGLSSNLCKGLLEMKGERATGDVEINVQWASASELPIPGVPDLVRIPHDYFRHVEIAHRLLRPERETDDVARLVGTVETLNGDVGADGRRAGEVVLAILPPNDAEELVRARVELSADDYAKAVEAHNRGTAYVRLRGRLKRGARISRIEEVRDFELDEG